MSMVKVQCSGSGRKVAVGLNTKRAACPMCHRQQDVAGNGRIRKHNRMTRTSKLKRRAKR